MKEFISGRGALLALLITLAPCGAHAGDAPMTIYSELTFVDVAPGQAFAFERGVRELVAPVQQQRVDDRELFAFALYALEYGTADHDYVLIRQAIGFEALAPPRMPAAAWEAAHGDADREASLAAWTATFEVTERTLFDLRQFHTNLELAERPWLTLTYVRTRPGRSAEFEAVMDEAWDPVFADWVATGGIAALSRYRLIQPQTTNHAYDQVLVAQHPDFLGLRPDTTFLDSVARARPDTDFVGLLRAFGDAAESAGSETWRLVTLVRRRPRPAE
jgi:hypothetical protein